MALPTDETVTKLLASSRQIRARILRIARRLEALNEYSPDQALLVAADIVRTRLIRGVERREEKGVLT